MFFDEIFVGEGWTIDGDTVYSTAWCVSCGDPCTSALTVLGRIDMLLCVCAVCLVCGLCVCFVRDADMTETCASRGGAMELQLRTQTGEWRRAEEWLQLQIDHHKQVMTCMEHVHGIHMPAASMPSTGVHKAAFERDLYTHACITW